MKVIVRVMAFLVWFLVWLFALAMTSSLGPAWVILFVVVSSAAIGLISRSAIHRRLERAEREIARRKYQRASEAAQSVPTVWLIDALGLREFVERDVLLAELDADTAWALARLHRKGVPAEYVAELWQTGQPLDADALVASYRDGGAA